VESPLSCFAKDVGAPVLVFEFLSPGSNVFHSAFVSCTLSISTIPQLVQITSPDSGSVSILLVSLHNKHSINEDELITF
jgi:hypothetical protein